MASSFLEHKLKQIPDDFSGEVLRFLDLLQYKINAKQPDQKQKRKFGGYEGQIVLAPDYESPLPASSSHLPADGGK